MGFKGKLRQLFGFSPKSRSSKQKANNSNDYKPPERELDKEFASLNSNSGPTFKYGFDVIEEDSRDGGEVAPYAIDVFHDAESCAVRQSTNGSRLYDAVIKSVLEAIGKDVSNIDVDADCDVCWRFVLPMRDGRPFPTRTLKDLLTRGVFHINPGEMKGAVDIVIKDDMDRFRSDHCDDSLSTKQNRIAVLISGDRDFASNIRKIRQSGLKIVLLHTPCKTDPSFLDQIPPALALGTWEELIDESEMDAQDISKFSKRLSFRLRKRSFVAPKSLINDESQDNLDSEMDTVIIPSEYETNIPDFKFPCSKDLYKFLLTRKNYSIDANDLNLFWECYPSHRHEIGKISNFVQSAKAEGAFVWSHCKKSSVFQLQLNSPNMRKQSMANVLINLKGNFNGRKKSVIQSNSGIGGGNIGQKRVLGSSVCNGILIIASLAVITYIIVSVYVSCIFLGIAV